MSFIGMPVFPAYVWRRREKYDKYFVRPIEGAFRQVLDDFDYVYPVGWDNPRQAAREFRDDQHIRNNSVFKAPADVIRGTFPMPFDIEWLIPHAYRYGPFTKSAMLSEARNLARAVVESTNFDAGSLTRLYRQAGRSLPNPNEDVSAVDFSILLEVLCWEDLIVQGRKSKRLKAAISDWYAREGGIRPCEVCGYPFDVVWQHHGNYAAGKGHHICWSCEIREHPTGEELYSRIRAFVDYCGYVPSSGTDLVGLRVFESFSEAQIVDACKLYLRMGGIEYVRMELGSWFHGLVYSGVYPEGTVKTARGIKTISKDGHVCLSLGELQIDNWLHHHGIPHEREVHYPYHPELNPNGGRRNGLRSDWVVGDVWIEYFGMVGEITYDEKREQKTILASSLGLNLISIFPPDLVRIDSILGFLID